MSLSSAGDQGNSSSYLPRISSNGRFVAFVSFATNLVPLDTNGEEDVFVRDRSTGTTERVSVGANGAEGDGGSSGPWISADGRFVAFSSRSTNLIAGDTNAALDVFLRDRLLGGTERVSLADTGAQIPQHSSGGALTPDGRFVTFVTADPNVVPGDDNSLEDVFVRDRVLGTTRVASLNYAGAFPNGVSYIAGISDDGRYVAFHSYASNLHPSGANPAGQILVRDLLANVTIFASEAAAGGPGNSTSQSARLSANGRFVVFFSFATNLIPGGNTPHRVFVRDLVTGVTEIASLTHLNAPATSGEGSISGDGRFVAFRGQSLFITPDDTNNWADVFVRDRLMGTTRLLSVANSGAVGNSSSDSPDISADGRFVAFETSASTLVPGDTNATGDVFVRDLAEGLVQFYCAASPNSLGCIPAMSTQGGPSTTSTAPFLVNAAHILSQRTGLLFYGFARTDTPIAAGHLCVASPVRRTAPQSSGGVFAPTDCSGSFSFDMNARIRSGVDPALESGADVFVQYWSRDPGSASGQHLTSAVTFRIDV